MFKRGIKMRSLLAPISVFFAAMLLSVGLFAAISLDAAKQQGLVGEQRNGYLGVIKASNEVELLVKEVNAKRKAAYVKIARKNQLTLAQVAALAGKKAIEKTPAGEFVQLEDGSWKKKQ